MPIENDFIKQITKITEENIANEQFGVSELAGEVGMSRSNLLRKIKKLTNLSVSQFIRNVRLKHAKEMLKETTLTVSEISYKVGFGSPSYFIKCFGDYYGYPPGEVGKDDNDSGDTAEDSSSSFTHQLAAIMFTDIVGYTALMQQDEQKAIEFRTRHREIFVSVTNKFNGKILQYFGDGTLSTFNSAIDAVRCGIELQLAFRAVPEVPVRIGIHSGDIIFREDGIIGDGVNIASRIESLALAGSVFISEKVSDEVKNQTGINCIPLGKFELKNVDKPLGVCAVAHPGLVMPQSDQIANGLKIKSEKKGELSDATGKNGWLKWILTGAAVVVIAYLISISGIFERAATTSVNKTSAKKSIAVLPFINDSSDSTNVYIINGLMESTLNNLQQIKDLRVISRTSVEKYRDNPKTIAEIAKELNVNYLVEGSGQKIGDQILLNIQLIEAPTDKHLWAEQYKREANDIFNLQMEVAKNIAEKIEAIITPEEVARINKIPTDNLVAYDYFLKGLDLMWQGSPESLEGAISNYKKAIELDKEFARAYAGLAITYFFLDAQQTENKYSDMINNYADIALLLDSQLPQSLIAKALFYINNSEFEQAVSYLEKALEYNPNSALVINILADFYTRYVPNTEKYLEYALKGIQLDIAANDSITASFIYLHVSNAFIQSGFVNEAELYINKSLEYYPENLYSEYVKAYILYAKKPELTKLKDQLLETLQKDTSRLDVLQEVGKIYYFLRDYESAYKYYKRFMDIKEAQNLNIYQVENSKIGAVFSKMDKVEEGEKLLVEFKEYAENEKSIYKYLNLAMYFSFNGETNKAIENLRLFTKETNYHYWILLFYEIDPLMDNIRDHPEFRKILDDIETKFWKNHKRIKASLEEKNLLKFE